jgi:hypothetical protein
MDFPPPENKSNYCLNIPNSKNERKKRHRIEMKMRMRKRLTLGTAPE